jgi:hypothetical protein
MTLTRWLFGVALTIALSPVIFMLTAGLVARLNGCTLNEGTVHPCMVLGSDVGSLLYAGTVSAWFALITLPIAGLLALVWIAIEIIAAVRRHLRKGAEARAGA